MGTRWTALFYTSPGFDPEPLRARLQAAVDEVDAQMSTWKPDSDLMRLSAAPVGEWIDVPAPLLEVLQLGLDIGRASGGAFDIGMGDAVTAWGFGPEAASGERIRSAMHGERRPAHEVIEIRDGRLRKRAAITLDLNGIAKGYGVDRLAETLRDFGIAAGLVGIDGEMRAIGRAARRQAMGHRGRSPDAQRRAAHSDHRTQGRGRRDLGRLPPLGRRQGQAPLPHHGPCARRTAGASPASVTVVARELRGGGCLGDRPDGARHRRGRGACPSSRPRRTVPSARDLEVRIPERVWPLRDWPLRGPAQRRVCLLRGGL